MSIVRELAAGTPVERDLESTLRHEAVAYLNRLGQFHYFRRSALVVGRLPELDTPLLDRLILLRHKHGAHRSVDAPRSESDSLKAVHSMVLSDWGGLLFVPRPDRQLASEDPTRQKPWADAFLAFQIHDEAGVAVELVIERDHTTLMEECYASLERLLS